jgi:hypothetical protein
VRRASAFVLSFLLLLACGRKPPGDARRDAMARAARYLWSKQAADGGWHSETYGLLRSGQSLTPFVLNALLEVPPDVEPGRPEQTKRALVFLEKHLDAEGALGRADPSLEDYPNYATALAVVAAARSGRKDLAERALAALRKQQFSEELGWTQDHPAYGAWGMGGPPRTPPNTGHLDLSMTRHVLEALAAAGVPAGDPAFVRADTFVERLRNPDGGFAFSTVIVDANKAGRDADGWKSYGTATADGALALLAMGVGTDDARLRNAREWLIAHHRSDRVPGFAAETDPWATGMWHYYLAASARALAALGVKQAPTGEDWRRDVVLALAKTQRKDGSWANGSFLMKEDDPLIATTFALMALAAAR